MMILAIRLLGKTSKQSTGVNQNGVGGPRTARGGDCTIVISYYEHIARNAAEGGPCRVPSRTFSGSQWRKS